MKKTAGSQRSHRRRKASTEAPAYWLKSEERQELDDILARGDVPALAGLIRSRAKEAPRSSDEIETTLVGELLNLLASSGVPFPQGHRSGYGITFVMERVEADAARQALEAFMEQATEETLSDESSLVLYAGRPELVRQGIEHVGKALRIPSGHNSLLLIAR